jgi:hypothetical protein
MVIGIALLVALSSLAGPPQDVPPEITKEMSARIGVWVADNSAYRSEAEPWEAYAIEWSWGLGRKSLIGRLYGMRDGRDAATFWEFREFWHPGEYRLIASQFGSDGTYGVGPVFRKPDGTVEMVQTFHAPDGTTTRVGHRSEMKNGEQITRSFDVSEDGTWAPRRTYVWRKQAQ